MEGQPVKLLGTSVEQQHACEQQGISVRSGEEASRTKIGMRGQLLPRQHERRLTKGAYSLPLIFVLFHICFSLELIDVLFLLCAYQMVRTIQYSR